MLIGWSQINAIRPDGVPGPRGSVSQPDQRQEEREQSGGEPLQVDRGGGEEGLDAHIVETAADGAGETEPGLRLAMKTLRAPAVSLIEAFVVG